LLPNLKTVDQRSSNVTKEAQIPVKTQLKVRASQVYGLKPRIIISGSHVNTN